MLKLERCRSFPVNDEGRRPLLYRPENGDINQAPTSGKRLHLEAVQKVMERRKQVYKVYFDSRLIIVSARKASGNSDSAFPEERSGRGIITGLTP